MTSYWWNYSLRTKGVLHSSETMQIFGGVSFYLGAFWLAALNTLVSACILKFANISRISNYIKICFLQQINVDFTSFCFSLNCSFLNNAVLFFKYQCCNLLKLIK